MQNMREEMKKELTGHIIPFWKSFRDDVYGGFTGLMDMDLKRDEKAPKGCILNSRILWFFSEAAMLLKDDSLISYADHAYRFMIDHCVDHEFGGVFWSCTYDGKPLDTTKHTYNQAFAIYALSAYHALTGKEEPKALARELMAVIEGRCRDEGGYLEAYTRDFKPASNEKLSENGVMATRTMNTMLHVFEGYSGLYQYTADPEAKSHMEAIIDIFMDKVYNDALRRQEVFFDHEYNTLIDLTSYGHDIETSWLLDWGCTLLNDETRSARLIPALQKMAQNVYEKAYHGQGLYTECEKGIDLKSRVWWVQAETVLGFFNAWQRTGKPYFLDAAREEWDFIKAYQIDPREGSEWYSELDEHLIPKRSKEVVEPWKCPYHNGRMCMEIIRRVNA